MGAALIIAAPEKRMAAQPAGPGEAAVIGGAPVLVPIVSESGAGLIVEDAAAPIVTEG